MVHTTRRPCSPAGHTGPGSHYHYLAYLYLQYPSFPPHPPNIPPAWQANKRQHVCSAVQCCAPSPWMGSTSVRATRIVEPRVFFFVRSLRYLLNLRAREDGHPSPPTPQQNEGRDENGDKPGSGPISHLRPGSPI